MEKFCEYIKELRTDREIGLREFCLKVGVDPSNWSKIERGAMNPPRIKEMLDRITESLKLTNS